MMMWRVGIRLGLLSAVVAISAIAFAQASFDPIRIDPQHYKVEYEDAKIRVLRLRLLPGEKSPMQDHPGRTVVSLTNSKVRTVYCTGERKDLEFHVGEASHLGPMRYAIENVGTETLEIVLTEFKDQYVTDFCVAAPVQEVHGEGSSSTAAIQEKPKPSNFQAKQIKEETPVPAERNQAQAASTPLPALRKEGGPGTLPATLQRETPEGVVKTITLNGAELAYVDHGEGPAIIFLHDTLGDYRSWSNVMRDISRAAQFRLISYSRRYHYPNYSNGKERDYNFQQNEKDLVDFIRSLNAGAVVLMGTGYGSALASAAAEKNPELVRSIAIADPDFAELLPVARAEAARATRDEIYHIIRKPLNRGQIDVALETYVDWGRGSQAWRHLSAEARSEYKQNSNALKAQTYDAPSPALSCADFRKIAAPALVFTGELAPPNTHDAASALSSCLPSAKSVQVPGREYVGYEVDGGALLQFLTAPR